MSENIDEYIRENWGKTSREAMRKHLCITDGELIWHVGRLGLPFETRKMYTYSGFYVVYPDGHCSFPKTICDQLNLTPGVRFSYEVVSNKPREKVIKINVLDSN